MRLPSSSSPLLLAACWLLAAAAVAAQCPDIFQETNTVDRQAPSPPPALLGNLTRPERLRRLAAPLLVPRPVGSAGHEAVRARLSGFLRGLGWRVRHDRFIAETPLGPRPFASVVATRPGPAAASPRPVLVLAAHYDSAPVAPDARGRRFVGATDSAVPCAILLMLAEALDALRPTAGDATDAAAVRIVFLDGEEALGGRWTSGDSLYGSQHLADRWLSEGGVNPGCSAIDEVADFVLLDLIGARGPRLAFSALPGGPARLLAKERRDFGRLVAMETRLRAAGLLPEADDHPEPFFSAPPRRWRDDIPVDTVDDDHAPFRRLGVPALHLVPRPFPPGWHTPADDASSVHWGHSAAVARVLLAWLLDSMEAQT